MRPLSGRHGLWLAIDELPRPAIAGFPIQKLFYGHPNGDSCGCYHPRKLAQPQRQIINLVAAHSTLHS